MKEKLVDKLRRLRDHSPKRQMELAEQHAKAYVTNAFEKCVEKATADAEQGYNHSHVWYETVMTHGNRISAAEVYQRVVTALQDEGLKADWTLEREHRSNINRVVYKLGWEDGK